MTFLEQLSAAAEKRCPNYVSEGSLGFIEDHSSRAVWSNAFYSGARWALQSELVREMEAALAGMVESHEICMEVYKDMPLTLGCFNGSFLNEANKAREKLQKLKTARGENAKWLGFI